MISGKRQSEDGALHGLTLLELVVAVAVFAVISSLLYGTLSRTARTRAYTTAHQRAAAEARTVYTWLSLDLTGSLQIGCYPSGKKVFFSSTNGSDRDVDGGRTVLDFTAVSGLGLPSLDLPPALPEGYRSRGDQVRIRYRLERDLDTASAPGWNLIRYESRPPLEGFDRDRASRAVIASSIDELSLRFYDGRTWSDGWDAGASGQQQRAAPQMVEINLTVRTADGASLPFTSAVAIDYQESPREPDA